MRPLPIETTGEGPPAPKSAALGAAALTRIASSVRTILTLRRRARVKAPHNAFTAMFVQSLGDCFAKVFAASPLDTYSRTLRAMTSVKRASCRRRARTH